MQYAERRADMAVEKEFINPDDIYPAPWKFNQAVKVKQGGTTTVYISGIVGLHPDGSSDKSSSLTRRMWPSRSAQKAEAWGKPSERASRSRSPRRRSPRPRC